MGEASSGRSVDQWARLGGNLRGRHLERGERRERHLSPEVLFLVSFQGFYWGPTLTPMSTASAPFVEMWPLNPKHRKPNAFCHLAPRQWMTRGGEIRSGHGPPGWSLIYLNREPPQAFPIPADRYRSIHFLGTILLMHVRLSSPQMSSFLFLYVITFFPEFCSDTSIVMIILSTPISYHEY